MNQYFSMTGTIAASNPTDVITFEEFVCDENSHPRSVMTVRRTNNIPYPILVSSIHRILTEGDKLDPVTRVPYSVMDRIRAQLYWDCLQTFPDYKVDDLDTTYLYHKWRDTYKPECPLSAEDIAKVRLEAQCFLQAEDLVGIFKEFQGKGSLENRERANSELTDRTPWILRSSSVKDTQYDKAYTLTKKTINMITHHLIIHRIGEGFFYDVSGIPRGGNANQKITDWKGFYPTVIHLLEANVDLNDSATSFNREVEYV